MKYVIDLEETMYINTRLFFLSLTVVMVLIFGAVGPTPVYADDGTTPPPDAPVVDEPSADVPDVEEPAADTPVVDAPSADVPVVDAAPTDVPAVDAPVADAPVEDLTVSEVLEQLPAGTDLVVVDQNGEALPLASVDAAEVLAAPDPYFTVTIAGTPTLFQWFATAGACGGAPNCVDGTTTPIQDAIDYLSSNDYKPDDGYVYVENGTYVEDVTVDGLNWITTPAFLGLVSENGSLSAFLDGYFEISNMNDFALAGFTVRDNCGAVNDTYVYAHDNTGTLTLEDLYVINNGGDGITVEDHTGDVSVTGVDSSFNNGNGATIQATGSVDTLNATFDNNYLIGASLTGSKVTIEDSTFNNNGSGSYQNPTGQGLIINSGEKVNLIGVTANDNQLFGADIKANGLVAISNSFFSGNRVYTYTWGDGHGLQVVTLGNVALDNVTASNNYRYGASLTGKDVAINNSFFNSNSSGDNNDTDSKELLTGQGLIVTSGRSVALSAVEANANQLFGVDITAQDDVSIKGESLIKLSSFSGNGAYTWTYEEGRTFYGYGLKVYTKEGAISLKYVIANDNYLYGASLTGIDVNVDSSFFDSNGFLDEYQAPSGAGLIVNSSNGLVSLFRVEANENQLFGTDIQATDQVSIEHSFFSGNQSYEYTSQGKAFYGYGLKVVTTGNTTTDPNILLNGVTANFNNLWGASLESQPGSVMEVNLDVEVKNSQFNNNVSDSTVFIDDTGLLVKSAGNVLLDNVEAKENRLIGAIIEATGNVTITSSILPSGETPLTINGSSFSHNQGFTCVYTCDNEMIFWGYGLQVLTPGEILLDGVTADENYLFGASLNGSKVTVKNSTFNNNIFSQGGTFHGYGLQVIATGNTTNPNILLDGVTASGNGTTGAILDNVNTNSGVVISNSTFNLNKGTGLSITTSGLVTLTNVTATNNGINGVDIIGSCSSVGVTDGTYSNNGQYGINAVSAIVTLGGSPTFANNPAGNIFQASEGCPEAPVVPDAITTVGGNVLLDVPPTEGNPGENRANTDTTGTETTVTTTVTNDVVVGNVVALQNTSNTGTTNHRRNHSRDNRYSAALQIYKWYRHFRGNLFSYLSSGMGFSGNYYGHHRH